MRAVAAAGSLFTAFSLTACGGGGGTVGSTPTPAPTPPAAQTNPTLVNLQFSESFEGRGSINRFTLSGATGGVTNRPTTSNRAIQVRYDAPSGAYTISTGELADITFAPADKDTVNSNSATTAYSKAAGTKTEDLILLNPGTTNPELALTYSSYGAWQSITSNGTTADASTVFLVFGVKTQQADLPVSGTASYQTIIDGLFAGTGGLYVLNGSSSFSANFGAGTVSFSMSPTGIHILDGSTKTFGSLSGTGTINAGAASFDASAPASGGYSASLLGKFYGPAAAEMGATFLLSGADGQGNGVIIGKKN